MFLGLDISTSIIGFCILGENSSLQEVGSIDLTKEKSIFKKASIFRRKIEELKGKHKIKKVFVEENLQAFRPGLSSAKTIVTLARFNGMCSLVSSEVFTFDPEFINVNAARKSVGFKKKKDKSANTKEQVLEHVSALEPKIDWPTKVLKSGPRKGTVVLQNQCYDMADAYVIVKSQLP